MAVVMNLRREPVQMDVLSVRMPSAFVGKLDQLAGRAGVTRSEAVRQLVERARLRPAEYRPDEIESPPPVHRPCFPGSTSDQERAESD